MIKQSLKGLNSRSLADPYNKGFLPLITAPMNTVLCEQTYKYYLDNNVNVCMPRNQSPHMNSVNCWVSYSLDDFEKIYLDNNAEYEGDFPHYICIDTANGNMPRLYDSIKKAKSKYKDDLIIMSGNVSSSDAFCELACSGCDYIRVGIGGGDGCTTTVHTGVGQNCLLELIKECRESIVNTQNEAKRIFTSIDEQLEAGGYQEGDIIFDNPDLKLQFENIKKVKIVADGISSYIRKNNLHSNGYAAINNLLYYGADLVMIGSIFARSKNSASESIVIDEENGQKYTYKLHRGMSTKEEQETYKNGQFKHSEGTEKRYKVEYTLKEWLEGSPKYPNKYPGFINCIKSAMSYTGSRNLKEFKHVR